MRPSSVSALQGLRRFHPGLLLPLLGSVWLVWCAPARAQTWQGTDYSSPPVAGTESVSGDTVTVTGAGNGVGAIWYTRPSQGRGDPGYSTEGYADSMHYSWQSLSGNAQIIAHVASINGAGPAQAGVMLRAAGDATANNVCAYVTSEGGLFASWRGEPVSYSNATQFELFQQSGGGAGLWLKLVRADGGVMTYTSPDGTNWTPVVWHTINLGDPVNVGLLVDNPNQSTAATAVFDHVSVGPLAGPLPAPVAPTNLTVTSSGLDYAKCSWGAPPGPFEKLDLQRSADGTTFTSVWSAATLKATDPVPVSATDATCAQATTYTYRLAVVRGTAVSYSNTVTVTTPTVNVAVSGVWSSRATVNWTTPASPLTGFSVQYSSDGVTWKSLAATPDARSLMIDFLAPNTTYQVRVGGQPSYISQGSFSTPISFTTSGTPPPGSPVPPSNLHLVFFRGADCDLAWTDNSSDETGFYFEESRDGVTWSTPYTGANAGQLPANTTTFTDMNPSIYDGPGYFRVRSFNANGASDYATVTVVTPWVEPPTNLVTTAVSGTEVDLSWTDKATNETGYEVQRGAGSGYITLATLPPNTTTYQDLSAPPGVWCFYRVRTLINGGASISWATATVQTPGTSGPASITSVVGPDAGPYGPTRIAVITVNFSAPVTVTGTPLLNLTIGGATARQATYFSGSGSSTLLFRYATTAGDNGALAIQSPIVLNGGTVQTAGTNASLSFTPPSTTGVVFDTTPPGAPWISWYAATSSTPAFGGIAEPGALIDVREAPGGGNRFAGSATAAANGSWQVVWTTAPLPAGTYNFQAIARDAAGNTSAVNPPVAVTVSQPSTTTDTPPPTETITLQVTGTTAHSVQLQWNPPSVYSKVELLRATNDGPLAVIASWTSAPTQMTDTTVVPLTTYSYQLKITYTTAWTSNSVRAVTPVGAAVYPAPTILGITPDTWVVGDGITNADSVVMSGTTIPNATVHIFDGHDYQYTGDVVQSDANGNWSKTFTKLHEVLGDLVISVIAVDQTGNSTAESAEFRITSANPPSISAGFLPGFTQGVPVTFDLKKITSGMNAAGSRPFPMSYAAQGLPPGLSLSTDGVLSGTPTTAGTFAAQISTIELGPTQTVTFTVAEGTTPPPPATPPPTTPPPPTTTKTTPTITFSSPVSAIIVGQPIQLGATSSAGLPITYTVVSGDATISGNVLIPLSTATLIVRAATAADGTYNATSTDVNFGTPQKAAQTISVATSTGKVAAEAPITLSATSSSGLPITYTVVSGPATISGSTLTFTATGPVVVQAAQAGDGSYAAATTTLTFNATPVDRLVNLSSRLRVVGGDAAHTAIAGFVVTGTMPKQILIRAVGPTLSAFGLASPLANPTLKLFDAKGSVVATNSGWAHDAQIAAAGDALGAFRLGAGSKDAAILTTLSPGLYTAQVDSTGSGTVLIEVYDVAATAAVPTKQLINISTRGYVGTGDDVLVAGFVVAGDEPKRVLVRAVGPTLGSFGVSGTISDPVLTVYDAKSGAVAHNDNWDTAAAAIDPTQTVTPASDMAAAVTATGAFGLKAGSADAAMILTLNPGQYSAVVTGAKGATGAAMVEVYELP